MTGDALEAGSALVSRAGRSAPPARRRARLAAVAAAAALVAVPRFAGAGEGGTTHVTPGANATLIDALPTAPGPFLKAMYLNYGGKATARIPTAAGVATNAEVTANTLALGGGFTFDLAYLDGAHYTVAAFLPILWVDISAHVEGTAIRRQNSVSGLGDVTLVPVMLAWKAGDWQFDFLMPIYAPTGNYEKGRLGNTGLNYWTFDPMVGVVYSNKKIGFNAMVHAGFGINTKNRDTDYLSGTLLHLDGAVEQLLPVGPGFLAIGAEGFYFQQVAGDSGSGAVLGAFLGRTAGIGPLAGYVLPIGEQVLSVEVKWLAEVDTKNRLNGDYVWAKAAYKF